jgi:hypothetical protein
MYKLIKFHIIIKKKPAENIFTNIFTVEFFFINYTNLFES